MKQAGVSAGKVSEGARRRQHECGFHSLRHTFISALVAADIPAKIEKTARLGVLAFRAFLNLAMLMTGSVRVGLLRMPILDIVTTATLNTTSASTFA